MSFVQLSVAANLHKVLTKTLGICFAVDFLKFRSCLKNHVTNAVSIMYIYSRWLVVISLEVPFCCEEDIMCTHVQQKQMNNELST